MVKLICILLVAFGMAIQLNTATAFMNRYPFWTKFSGVAENANAENANVHFSKPTFEVSRSIVYYQNNGLISFI